MFGWSLAACGEDPAEPDLEAISRDYCTIVQECNPAAAFPSQEECEAHSSQEYALARKDDPPCFEALMNWEACVGALENCEEYDLYLYAMGTQCLEERDEFYNYCMVI
ncbi:hypothetical protein [Nannocystis bainbridge]|uniref:Lipoprotein n=1 Tax=Nannocystis bainbridge TaxID=2995303 RepID=A0ABT5E4U1_9BACT|nr:hypothetical protein [Nannocystis bainbridge]MDC0720425.1 hypothetical protein [Nannocystis bainbridge]